MDKFIINVREYREQAGITQNELSEQTGICRKTIALLEQPEGSNPKIGTLLRIAAYFKISVENLIGEQMEGDY